MAEWKVPAPIEMEFGPNGDRTARVRHAVVQGNDRRQSGAQSNTMDGNRMPIAWRRWITPKSALPLRVHAASAARWISRGLAPLRVDNYAPRVK